jgi:hypothetical protein
MMASDSLHDLMALSSNTAKTENQWFRCTEDFLAMDLTNFELVKDKWAPEKEQECWLAMLEIALFVLCRDTRLMYLKVVDTITSRVAGRDMNMLLTPSSYQLHLWNDIIKNLDNVPSEKDKIQSEQFFTQGEFGHWFV